MGRLKLSNLFLALAAGLDLVKSRPGSLEALSCHELHDSRDQLKNIFYLYIKVNKKTKNPHMQSQTLHAYKGKYKNEKNPHAISNFTQV